MNYKYNLINLNNILGKDINEIKEYFRFNGINKFDNNDIVSLLSISEKIINKQGFNISYNIERLDKEFDLIKYGNDILVNVELKISNRDIIQCENNYKILKKYYGKEDIYIFCFEENKNNILKYNDELKILETSSYDELNNVLNKITKARIININFNVSSVYVNPDFYLDNNYSLSNSQQITKNKIINSSEKMLLISGRAGTGKTLLALDLYDYYINNDKSVIYLTPFKVNNLVCSELKKKVKMRTVKSYLDFASEDTHDIAMIDEAQRLKCEDIEKLKLKIREKIIMLGDINQTVDYEEGFKKLYEKNIDGKYNINQIIRTDDTFDYFARKMLNKSTKGIKNKKIDLNKIKIYMIDDINIPVLSEYTYVEPAQSLYFASCFDKCENHTCKMTSDVCSSVKTTYDVIGQEYSKVAMHFCDRYFLNFEGKISCSPGVCYGYLENQIYTIITRTIDELIIIVEDITLYNYLNKIKENIKL